MSRLAHATGALLLCAGAAAAQPPAPTAATPSAAAPKAQEKAGWIPQPKAKRALETWHATLQGTGDDAVTVTVTHDVTLWPERWWLTFTYPTKSGPKRRHTSMSALCFTKSDDMGVFASITGFEVGDAPGLGHRVLRFPTQFTFDDTGNTGGGDTLVYWDDTPRCATPHHNGAVYRKSGLPTR